MASSNIIRADEHGQVSKNIKRPQAKQQRDYESGNNLHHKIIFISAPELLLRNNKRKDQEGGQFTFKWLGSNVVSDITKKGLVTLKNKNDKELKKKYDKVQLKLLFFF